jgi:hypothetical protein
VSEIDLTDLLADYLLHGSLAAIAGLIDPTKLTYDHFDQHISDRWGKPGNYELFSIDVERKVGRKVYGAELKFRFYQGELYSDSIRAYGEPINVCAFLDSFGGLVSATDVRAADGFGFETFLYEDTVDEGAMIFGNAAVLRFNARDASSDFFAVYSIDGGCIRGGESTAEADRTSVKTVMRPLDLIANDMPRVLGLKRWVAALKARSA